MTHPPPLSRGEPAPTPDKIKKTTFLTRCNGVEKSLLRKGSQRRHKDSQSRKFSQRCHSDEGGISIQIGKPQKV